MKSYGAALLLATLLLATMVLAPTAALAQMSGLPATVIPLNGRLSLANGEPRTGTALLVFAIYAEERDASPLWIEYQVVALDPTGRYDARVGASFDDGIPAHVFAFTGGAARWLGVTVENEPEQPRMRLVSVPYAVVAGSAATLDGRPPTDFVFAENLAEGVRDVLRTTDLGALFPASGAPRKASETSHAACGGCTYESLAVGGTDATLQFVSSTGTAYLINHTGLPDWDGRKDSLAIQADVPGGIWIGSNSAAPIKFSPGGVQAGSEKVRITALGDVGIGTTNPFAALDIRRSGDAFIFLADGTPGGAIPTIHIRSNNQSAFIMNAQGATDGRNDALALQSDTAGGIWLGTNASTPIVFSPGGTATAAEKMRITHLGRVGIGTTTPQALLHVAGDVVVDGNIGAKYQDVAEWVEGSGDLPAGTVVIVDVARRNGVTSSTRAYDSRVAGAISPQPGIILGERGPGKVLVAQSGRVKIKVDARYGAIKPGDLVVTSPRAGYAMRSKPVKVGDLLLHRPGTVLGKALEPLAKGEGEILVLLTLQ
jgi:hypothetical protein